MFMEKEKVQVLRNVYSDDGKQGGTSQQQAENKDEKEQRKKMCYVVLKYRQASQV